MSNACILCDSSKSKVVAEIPDLWLERLDKIFKYVQCENCGLIYQSPGLSREQLMKYYSFEYRQTQAKKTYFHCIGLRRRAKIVTGNRNHGVLLDIGSGNGEFIRFMRDNYNWEVVGLEIDCELAKTSVNLHQLKVFCGTLEEVNFNNNQFDAITLWDTLEHVPDPSNTLKEIRRIIKPDGILILRLPNYDSRDARLFGKYWCGFDSPRHLFVFSERTINELLMKANFHVEYTRSDIGSYLNFIKSIQFWMIGMGFSINFRRFFLRLLKTPISRLIGFVFMAIKDVGGKGSELVVVASPSK